MQVVFVPRCFSWMSVTDYTMTVYTHLFNFIVVDMLARGMGHGSRNLIIRNPVTASVITVAKVRLVTFLRSQFGFLLFSSSRHFSLSFSHFNFTHYSNWNLNFPINYIMYHATEYCAVMRSMVQGSKLFNGHVPDPFLSMRNGVWPCRD